MMERVQPCKRSLQKAAPFLSCIGRTPYSDALSTWRGVFEPSAKVDTPRRARSIIICAMKRGIELRSDRTVGK